MSLAVGSRCYDEISVGGASGFLLTVADEHYDGSSMTVPAKYENGVFRPLGQVQIAEGTIVEVHLPAGPQGSGPRPRSVREFAFCGMWKDRDDMADSVEYINRLRENLRG
jgi:hypothetical protein